MKYKLVRPNDLLNFYPLINSSLTLQGEVVQLKPMGLPIDVMSNKNGVCLIRVPAMGFTYVWQSELEIID